MPPLAASVGRKNAAERPRAKEGGGREEENRPGIAACRSRRLRNRKLDRPALPSPGHATLDSLLAASSLPFAGIGVEKISKCIWPLRLN